MRKIMAVLGDKKLTKMMQDFDVFESFKVILAKPIIMEVVPDWNKDNLHNLMAVFNNNMSPFILLAILEGKEVHYKNESVKSVSDGSNWALFDYYLETLKVKQ